MEIQIELTKDKILKLKEEKEKLEEIIKIKQEEIKLATNILNEQYQKLLYLELNETFIKGCAKLTFEEII